MNNKNPCASVFRDITKAFDTLDLSLLLYKLEILGFRGQFKNLLSPTSTTANNMFFPVQNL